MPGAVGSTASPGYGRQGQTVMHHSVLRANSDAAGGEPGLFPETDPHREEGDDGDAELNDDGAAGIVETQVAYSHDGDGGEDGEPVHQYLLKVIRWVSIGPQIRTASRNVLLT